MHLLNHYALTCGAKVGRPHVYERFFPLAVSKYITLQAQASCQSKTYDYWAEVVAILHPILLKEGISIVQIGGKGDKVVPGCYFTGGQTNIGQAAYILRDSLLHLGVDSFGVHMASAYDKPIVSLYSSMFSAQCGPYWSDPSKVRLFETATKDKKPSYALQENPKSINTIKPEEIARSVCELLGIEFDYEYRSVYFGFNYSNKILEAVPDSIANFNHIKIDHIVARMDFHFNEKVLMEQLKVHKCAIVTNKPINIELLKAYRSKIKEVFYFLTEDHVVGFVEQMIGANIPFKLVSELTGEALNKLKLYYMDYGLIHPKPVPNPEEMEEFKGKDLSKLYYKSTKFTVSQGKIYQSKSAWKNGVESGRNLNPDILPIQNTDDFWSESNNFYIMEKIA